MKSKSKIEFGDFQTPLGLALSAAGAISARGINPASIVEPTCGLGNFVEAAILTFPGAKQICGLEINPEYLNAARGRLQPLATSAVLKFQTADFLKFQWEDFFRDLPEPILVLGNPPWVTSAELSAISSENLPVKSNFQNLKGLDARTGKSNFDIAEWMLIHLLESLRSRRATIAMLVKTSVARKLLSHIWNTQLPVSNLRIHPIDTNRHFNVAVDACLFECDTAKTIPQQTCTVCSLADSSLPTVVIGYDRQRLIANMRAFDRWQHLQLSAEAKPPYKWRSGIKHDCSKVIELHRVGSSLINGFGESVNIEDTFVYPMLKGSEVARVTQQAPSRFMLVPQRETGETTEYIQQKAPDTWSYLCRHGTLFDARASSIYRGRPRFSIFGIGSYSFAPWKVAICSLYKRLQFTVVGPRDSKPTVLDDTAYHLSFESELEARLVAQILNDPVTTDFFSAFIFWDAKRAITAEILHHLDILALADELSMGPKLRTFHSARPIVTARRRGVSRKEPSPIPQLF